jgi:hypothetical protein
MLLEEKCTKPSYGQQYLRWLETSQKVTIDDHYVRYYESLTNKLKKDLEESVFWKNLLEKLKICNEEYQLQHNYPLFATQDEPELLVKPFSSFLLKTYRKNILKNDLWPNEPKKGWLLPNNWFLRINDVLRTLIVVKYLDGVEFLTKGMDALCKQNQLGCRTYFEAREEGYYAAHFYTKREFEVPKLNWDTEIVKVSIEIQITTQLQEVIRRLLHKYYEQRRQSIIETDEKWQWDYKSDEFSANYLGHILHYVEGMIMEIREEQEAEKNEKRIR